MNEKIVKYMIMMLGLLHQENLMIMKTLYMTHISPKKAEKCMDELEEAWKKAKEEIDGEVWGE